MTSTSEYPSQSHFTSLKLLDSRLRLILSENDESKENVPYENEFDLSMIEELEKICTIDQPSGESMSDIFASLTPERMDDSFFDDIDDSTINDLVKSIDKQN
ncbi:hypothetical protein RF11_12416 [Thelohanellus kitauei]|uniref:Uncharacterized protein n=1 Tax=Thelohanellus kitauei TaxID=669202 RepID=A0A0C2ME86_THEKT|nr:hypothetical protein RF11_12416 [Thelohanellus kitauei]